MQQPQEVIKRVVVSVSAVQTYIVLMSNIDQKVECLASILFVGENGVLDRYLNL